MLTKEKIEALLKIDTQNKTDTRAIRIMSCDNPIKDLFVYDLNSIREEFNENPKGFESQLALCIYKYDKELNLYLNGQIESVNVKAPTITLKKQMIQNSIKEFCNFYALLKKVADDSDYSYQTLYDIIHFRLDNYTSILQLCGLINISDNEFRSKFLSRVINVKIQTENFKDGKMSPIIFANEYAEHIDYIGSQLKLINDYELYDEDFLIYVIMFDIRHYKRNRKNKMLRKRN